MTARLLCPWDSPGKNTGVGSHSLLHRIFPTQGLNSGLLPCRQILYHLSHQGSPYSVLTSAHFPRINETHQCEFLQRKLRARTGRGKPRWLLMGIRTVGLGPLPPTPLLLRGLQGASSVLLPIAAPGPSCWRWFPRAWASSVQDASISLAEMGGFSNTGIFRWWVCRLVTPAESMLRGVVPHPCDWQ